MYRDLGSCPYLRLLQDTVPEQSLFVYNYITYDLLSLAQKDLPITHTKRILKDTLRGLAALHDRNIVHTGKLGIFCTRGPWTMADVLQMSRRTISWSSEKRTIAE